MKFAVDSRKGGCDNGLVEFMPRMEGTTLHAIIAPTRKAEAAAPKKIVPEAKPAEAEAVPVANGTVSA